MSCFQQSFFLNTWSVIIQFSRRRINYGGYQLEYNSNVTCRAERSIAIDNRSSSTLNRSTIPPCDRVAHLIDRQQHLTDRQPHPTDRATPLTDPQQHATDRQQHRTHITKKRERQPQLTSSPSLNKLTLH